VNEDKPLNAQEMLKKLPVPMPQVIPQGQGTQLVTNIKCESDSGIFTLQLMEYRAVEPYAIDDSDRFKGKSANVVVGRYILSPVALVHLKNAIAAAEAYHVAHWGPLPDVQKFMAQLMTEMPSMPGTAPEVRAGFRNTN
jgi:hypothetical protein